MNAAPGEFTRATLRERPYHPRCWQQGARSPRPIGGLLLSIDSLMAAQESAELRGRRSNAETAGLIGFFDALISTDTDPAVDLVVHTSTGTNGRIGMSEHAVVARVRQRTRRAPRDRA